MAFDFLGDDVDFFMKSSWQVYCDASGSLQYVGKTGTEKTFSPALEQAEWYDNSSGVQTLYALATCKFEISVSFNWMQVLDPNTITMVWNADLDTTDPNYNRLYFGSNPAELGEYGWRFVGQGKSGLTITLVMRKGICIPNGDWTTGAACEWTSIPCTVRGLQDTSITNTARDLAYFEIQKKTYS